MVATDPQPSPVVLDLSDYVSGEHCLVVRPRPGIGSEAIAAHARAAGHTVWCEPVAAVSTAPAALARRERESRRALRRGSSGIRMLVLAYADGVIDLLATARRAELTAAGLRALADRLVHGTGPQPGARYDPGGPDGASRPADLGDAALIPSVAAPEWGLGDPSATGWGEVEVRFPSLRLTRETVSAALERCAAGHAGTAAPGESGQSVGVLFDTPREGEDYRPFLEPVLPIVVHARPEDGTMRATLAYRENAIAPEVARDFAAHLAHVAAQLDTQPDTTPAQLELLSAEEALRLIRLGATPAPAPQQGFEAQTIHGLLAEIVRRRPESVALCDEKTEYTYAQLDARAERMARGLAALGARPGAKVVVGLERGAEFVVVLLAVLKAGCTYVPVDVRYPQERIRYTVEDCAARVAVARPEDFPAIDGVVVTTPEELLDAADAQNAATENPDAENAGVDAASDRTVDGSTPAYVIYTSGSTGHPKGVVVPHRNVAALVAATRTGMALGERDTWTFFHSTAFDFSVWEIWGCLLTGGRLIAVPHWVGRDTELFHDLVRRESVSVLSQTPSAFAQFVQTDARSAAALPALRLVVFGGEALDTGILGPWFARHSATACRLVNMFGITETTVHVTEQTVTPAEVAADSRSVGRALPGWSVSVRDEHGRVLPVGTAGEIYVGGAGVARGYLNRPELTEQRFVTDPLTGARLYRSGDLGRLRPDGRLDHLGRIDSQVKIRGHRVELDEIRGVLLGHPAVAAAAVTLRLAVAGDRDTARIDAYYVTHGGAPLAADELAWHAARLLPDYMRPATLTRLDAIPLTVNGKADLKALPEPGGAAEGAAARPAPASDADTSDTSDADEAREPLAAAVLEVWGRMLHTDAGLDDNFFTLGGNSLMVVRALRELADRGLPRISVRDFYRNSDARAFVDLLRQERQRAAGSAPR